MALTEHISIFNKDLSQGYNQQAGKHTCKLNWAGNQRPLSKKVLCPNYNTQLNTLLQEVCDDLTQQGVLGYPQDENVIVQHISPCFLRKKQKAKDKKQEDLTKNDVKMVINLINLNNSITNFV